MSLRDTNQVKVWDLLVRLFHWTLVLSFVIAYLTEDDWMTVHVYAGYVIGFLLLFRMIWGFVGSRYARFSSFVYRPGIVRDYLKKAVAFKAPRYMGHNPAGGAMILMLILVLATTVISGLFLYGTTDYSGPFAGVFQGEFAADILEETHEIFANLSVLLILLHLGGVIFSSLEHRENLVKSMVTGFKKEKLS